MTDVPGRVSFVTLAVLGFSRPMRARLVALILLAGLCCSAFAVGGPARAEQRSAAPTPRPMPMPTPALTASVPVTLLRCPIPMTFRPGFETAARETALPLALLVALGEIESGLRPDAVSTAGARGLLQLMPVTADEVRVDAGYPEANVLGGARYLRLMLDRFESTDLALAAYNAGPTAVARAGGAPSGETLTYVADVTGRWRALVGCR
jgi:soluble lytic murein transglycosylase-like protein